MKAQHTPASAQRKNVPHCSLMCAVLQGDEYCVSILFINSYIRTSRETGHKVKVKGHQQKFQCRSLSALIITGVY